MTTHLLVIDPQNDFVDPQGALSVKGAFEDAQRLARLVDQRRMDIAAIHISLDSHHRLDISHPLWFIDENGDHPTPFTCITANDLQSRKWQTARTEDQSYTLSYLEKLAQKGRYPHIIWPEHCLIGSHGTAIPDDLLSAFQNWTKNLKWINFIYKGDHPYTEHFSAIEAEVPIETASNTQVNQSLIAQLESASEIWVSGWARSHCLGNSVRDLIKYGSPDLAQKLVLLSDTTSDVPGFEHFGDAFLKEAMAKGMRVARAEDLMRG
jgi:nicotinamidase/pyrazinamidase